MDGDELRIVRSQDWLGGMLKDHGAAARKLAAEIQAGMHKKRQGLLQKNKGLLNTLVLEHQDARATLYEMFPTGEQVRVQAASRVLKDRDGALKTACTGLRETWTGQLRRHFLEDSAAILARGRQLAQREDRMKDFFGTSPGLWDLEEGLWNSIDWDGIEAARTYLERYPELRELARRLGKSWAPQQAPRKIPRISTIRESKDEARGRSELLGYQEGRDLEQTLPSEFALLADPVLRDLFLQRFADGRLNNRAYHTHEETEADRGRRTVVYDEEPQARIQGPVILCVDTSGSMVGEPEQCAKALALLFGGICLEEGRKAYLIAFSTETRTFDLTQPGSNLPELSRFLAGGFHGGTDLRPALAASAELLMRDDFKHADIVVLSDFKVPKILIKKANLVQLFRSDRLSRIHGISVNDYGLSDDLHLFDSTWYFSVERPGRQGGIAEAEFRKNSL